MDVRKSKFIKNKELYNELINLTEKDITSSFIFDLFGEFDGKVKANPYDLIKIPPGVYGTDNNKNKNEFITTVGIWIFNKMFIEQDLFKIYKYINKNIDSKLFGKINKDLSFAVLEDDISLDVLKRYLMKTQISMQYVTVLAPNYSEKILTCTNAISKKKEELINANKKELEEGNIHVAETIENELLDYAKEYMKDDPSMDSFLSGARGSINNNFKNMYVMKGAIKNPDPNAIKEYSIATSNYMDGISKDEYALYSNSLAAGPYSRGKKTEGGGYWEKLFLYACQHVIADEPGTDCGTDRTISFVLTEKNFPKHVYDYIVTNSGELVELTTKNKSKYIGKKIRTRHSELCKNDKICSKCVGNLIYRLGNVRNIGVMTPQIASVLKNKAMKAFHDSTVSTTEMDVMEAFGLK